MSQSTPQSDILDNLIETIRDAVGSLPIPFGILYGSVAAGRATPMSDIDIAVYSASREDFLKAVQCIDAAFPDRRVDVVNLRGQAAYFYYNVLAKGRLIWCRDETLLVRERHRVMREYLDFKPMHERLMNDMRHRLETGAYGTPTAAPERA